MDGGELEELLNRLRALGDLQLSQALTALALELTERFQRVAAERDQEQADLEAAPWRGAKGNGKGRGRQNGRRRGPYY